MVYAVRRYVKGVKNSGTRDIWVGDYLPTEQEITSDFGLEGKYVVIQRGKGIRGFRKVAEYGPYEVSNSFSGQDSYKRSSEWMPKSFAAEEHSINVKKQINIQDIADDELDKLWGSMLDTPVESEDDFDRFSHDTQKIRAEINRRLNERSNLIKEMSEDGVVAESALAENEHLAEALSAAQLAAEEKGGHSTIAVVMAGVTGLVIGGVAQEVRWSRKMTEAEERMARLEAQINQLMEKEEERAAEEKAAPKENPFSTSNLLRQFNANNMR
jgi:outer membrane murein-binding lipoprotein Lpp